MILLLCGGGGSEHNISILSADFIEANLKDTTFKYIRLTLLDNFQFIDNENNPYSFTGKKLLKSLNTNVEKKIDYIIPCIHGTPGEDGKIQAYFELLNIPYMGSTSEASILCFNKISTKLWAQNHGVSVVPFVALSNTNSKSLALASDFFQKHQNVFIKATHQGSSIGVFHVTDQSELIEKIKQAFTLSPYVLIEQTIQARELEMVVFEYRNQINVSGPSEIELPGNQHYSYKEKYDQHSHTKVHLEATGIPNTILDKMKRISKEIFENLKLKDLARVDFFLDGEQIYFNELNTFPGHTTISVFPLLLETSGISYNDFLTATINKALNET